MLEYDVEGNIGEVPVEGVLHRKNNLVYGSLTYVDSSRRFYLRGKLGLSNSPNFKGRIWDEFMYIDLAFESFTLLPGSPNLFNSESGFYEGFYDSHHPSILNKNLGKRTMSGIVVLHFEELELANGFGNRKSIWDEISLETH